MNTLMRFILPLCILAHINHINCFSFGFLGSGLLSSNPVCYGEYGCFDKLEISKDWEVPNVLGFFPQPPEEIDVLFNLFTCNQKYNPVALPYNASEKTLKSSGFSHKHRTVFIIHGYRDYFSEVDWMGDIRDTIFKISPCRFNVIAVDWHKGGQIANYLQAASNTQVVGAVIANLIKKLNNVFSTTNDDYTITGHSLGSHISGFAGKNLQSPEKVRCIIGMDPAGPAFTSIGNHFRLNSQDAKLVLTIHTNAGKNAADGFGIIEPLGHYNFYPNGGYEQAGCEAVQGVTNILMSGLTTGLTDTVACSHRRATRLVAYNESLYENLQSVGYRCDTYEDFQNGRCLDCEEHSDNCRPFGSWFEYWQEQFPSPSWSNPISYFLDTNSKFPYGVFHYGVKVQLGSGFTPVNGKLILQLSGNIRDDYQNTVEIEGFFEPDNIYSKVFTISKSLKKIVKGAVYFKSAITEKSQDIKVSSIEVHYMSELDPKQREKLFSKLTPVEENSHLFSEKNNEI